MFALRKMMTAKLVFIKLHVRLVVKIAVPVYGEYGRHTGDAPMSFHNQGTHDAISVGIGGLGIGGFEPLVLPEGR